MADDDKTKIQEQFNESLKQTQSLLEAQARIASQMLGSFTKLNELMRGMGVSSGVAADNLSDLVNSKDTLEELTGEMQEQNKAMEEAAKLLEEQNDGTNVLHGTMSEFLTKTTKKWLLITSAMSGFWHGMKFTMNIGKGMIAWGKNLAVTLGHIALSIASIPFKLLRVLIEMQATSGSNELAQQLEEIRKQFGYLNKTAGGAVVAMARSMKGELSNTGLSVYRVMGRLVERLKEVFEWAKALGPTFDAVRNRIGQGGVEALFAYNKALGFTQEGLKGIAQRALSTGRNINDINQEVANYSLQLADAFDLTMKEVSRDVGNMIADFKNFGHLGVQQLTQVAAYARKLGMEVKALAGVLDKFANFEEAAQGASQLAQAFGLNIDAMRLMKAQDPAEKLEMIRKAFFATGRTIENMSYQERRLLATQTGLDDASVALAFSIRNQGALYGDLKKKGDAARKSQLTQAEAMQKLAGAIERLTRPGSGSNLGFIDQFFAGFRTGIVRTREFRQIMRSLRRSLRATWRAGVQVGRAFVHIFPGVKQVFGSLRDMFNPSRFRTMLGGIKEVFTDLFKALAGNDRRSLPALMERLREKFFNFFNSRSTAGRNFLQGTQKFFSAFATIANFLLKKAIDGVVKMIKFATDLLAGRTTLTSAIAAGQDGAMGFLSPIITNLIDGLGEAGTRLWEAIKGLFHELFDKIKNWAKANWFTVLRFALLPSAIGMVLQPAGTLIGLALIKGITHFFKEHGVQLIGRSLGGAIGSSGMLSRVVGAVTRSGLAGQVRGASEVADAVGSWKSSAVGAIGSAAKLAIILLFLTYGLPKLVKAGIELAKEVKSANLDPETVAKTVGLMFGVSAMLVAGGMAANVIAQTSPTASWKGMGIGLAGLAGVVSIMLLGAMGILGIMKMFNPTKELVAKTVAVIAAISGMFLAAAGVLAVATLVGAAVALTKGTGLFAVGIGVGLIVGMLGIMTSAGMKIMDVINNFKAKPGFADKARAFASIISSIGSFAGNMATIISSLDEGLVGMIASWFTGETMEKKLKAATKLIETMANKTQELVSFVVRKSQELNPRDLENGQRLVEVLAGIGRFARDLMPAAEALQGDFWTADTVGAKLENLSTYVETLVSNLRSTLSIIVSEVRILAANDYGDRAIKASEIIKNIFQGLGEFAKGITPHSSLVERATASGDAEHGLTAVARYIHRISDIFIRRDLFGTIGLFVSSMANAVSSLNAGQLKAMSSVAEMVKTAFEAFGAIGGVIRSITGSGSEPLRVDVLQRLDSMVTNFINGVASTIPRIINSVKEIRISRVEAALIRSKVELAKTILETVGKVPEIFSNFKNAYGTGASLTQSGAGIYSIVFGVTDAISMLFDKNKHAEARNLHDAIRSIGELQIQKGTEAKLNVMKSLFETIGKFSEIAPAVRGMGQNLTEMQAMVRSRTVEQVGNAAAELVAQVNSTTARINSLSPVNVQVALRTIARNLGLNDSTRFEVRERNVTIQVNVDVTMRADALQEALIQTSERTQRPHRRLNFETPAR